MGSFSFLFGEDKVSRVRRSMAASRSILPMRRVFSLAFAALSLISMLSAMALTLSLIHIFSSYECSPLTVDEEFMLSKRQYELATGRRQKSDVIAYQIRQSFKPG